MYHLFGAEAITLHSPVRNETEGGVEEFAGKKMQVDSRRRPLIIQRVLIPKYSNFI